MENWQFLIQKQGEHRWHPLESPTVELPEGKYRVVANSNYANTDVEVRVTHYSHHESPPKRYVKKRSRRTNTDGVMAVIPFTSLKPGSWELRCSGDLMSDIMGNSWKFSVRLEVLPNDTSQGLVADGGEAELVSQDSGSVTEQSPTQKHSQQPVDTDVEQLVTSASMDDDGMGDATITISAEQVTVTSSYPTAPESTLPTTTDEQFNVPEEVVTTGDVNPSDVTNVSENLPFAFEAQPDNNDRKSASEENNDHEIDQLVSPVLLKGETAEQILQNLADLALPTNEPALEEEEQLEQPLPEIVELPLIITLDAENYFVPWGEAFTIGGGVELKDVSASPKIYGGELHIELHSPLGGSSGTSPQDGEAIAQTRQVVSSDTLPFSFDCELQVPQDCPSKLILADINLYGALDDGTESVLLASHTFTINAAVTELLALSAAAQSRTSEELLSFSDIVVADTTKEEAKVSTPLDLQLFNLVKILPKEQSLVTQPKAKTSLPPRIDPYSLQQPAPSRSPQLPNLPSSSNQNQKQELVVAGTQTTTHTRWRRPRGTSLPYLKKLQPIVTRHQATQPEPITENDAPPGETLPTTGDENSNGEQVVNRVESPASQEPALSSNAELITTTDNPDSLSPLIRHWIRTQGYTLPQPINVQYQDYDTEQIFVNELDVDSGVIPEEPEQTSDRSSTPPLPPPPPPNPYQRRPAWLAQEIVVDDTDATSLEVETTNNSSIESEQPSTPPEPPLLPPQSATQEPLPVPELYIPTGELTAGKQIKVRVKLPNLGPHIAIKLWLKDCQTRRLINQPHILKNWIPEPPHHLQLTTQLQVPLGCLQIQFEAIAIDLTTQQESHKVSIIRSVIPADLPQILTEEPMGI
ncbi:MAG: hypothetical protein QNJ63_09160 [Calothrix sp. MO_192.B10]|nr:hypothetical protein [Calothrix sp. MO_192.B10]